VAREDKRLKGGLNEMLVGVTGFGSVWRRRIREDGSDRRRFAHTSYFNTTGLMANGRLVRRRKIAGHVRLDAVSGFNPNYPSRAIGRVFECAEPCVWKGQNKVLFRRLLRTATRPDYFLVVTRSTEVGRVDLTATVPPFENALAPLGERVAIPQPRPDGVPISA